MIIQTNLKPQDFLSLILSLTMSLKVRVVWNLVSGDTFKTVNINIFKVVMFILYCLTKKMIKINASKVKFKA